MTTCIGCEVQAEKHPYVAVMQGQIGFEAQPVCLDCWHDTAHRKRPIKAHFFQAHQATQAVAMAGSANISG